MAAFTNQLRERGRYLGLDGAKLTWLCAWLRERNGWQTRIFLKWIHYLLQLYKWTRNNTVSSSHDMELNILYVNENQKRKCA